VRAGLRTDLGFSDRFAPRHGPVEYGLAQPLLSGIAHYNDAGLATPLGRRRHPGQGPERTVVPASEWQAGGRQVFGGVAKAGTDIEGLIRKTLDAVGGTGDTALTAFTDGCPGLRGILVDAGILEPPILDAVQSFRDGAIDFRLSRSPRK
jgi:hypothetical protein